MSEAIEPKSPAAQVVLVERPSKISLPLIRKKNRILYLAVLGTTFGVLGVGIFLRNVGTAWGTFFTVTGTLISALAGYLTTKIAAEQEMALAEMRNISVDQDGTLRQLEHRPV